MDNSRNSSKYAWFMLILSFVSCLTIYIPYIGYTTQSIAIMEDLNLNYTQIGMLGSVCSLSMGVIILFSGPIGYRWGTRKVALVGLIVCVLSQIVFAMADSYSAMIISRLLAGIGCGLAMNAFFSLPMRWLANDRRLGLASSVLVACDGVGSIFAMYIYAYVLIAMGWQTGTIVGAVIIGVAFIVCVPLLKEPPEFYEQKKRRRIWIGNAARCD